MCVCVCVCVLEGVLGSRTTDPSSFCAPRAFSRGHQFGESQELHRQAAGWEPVSCGQTAPTWSWSCSQSPCERSSPPVRCKGQTSATSYRLTVPCVWFIKSAGPRWAEIKRSRFLLLSLGANPRSHKASVKMGKGQPLGASVPSDVKQVTAVPFCLWSCVVL